MGIMAVSFTGNLRTGSPDGEVYLIEGPVNLIIRTICYIC